MLIVVSLLHRIALSNLLWLFRFALPRATYLHNERLSSRVHRGEAEVVSWKNNCNVGMKLITKWNFLKSTMIINLLVFLFQLESGAWTATFQKQEFGSWPFMTPRVSLLLCYCCVCLVFREIMNKSDASLDLSILSVWQICGLRVTPCHPAVVAVCPWHMVGSKWNFVTITLYKQQQWAYYRALPATAAS